MKVRRATCIHGLVLGLAAFLWATQMLPVLSSSAAAADDGMKWQFNEANDPDNKGRMTARLIYGVPETDAIQVSGVCEARSGSGLQASSLTLGADIGALDDGKEVDVHFSGNGFGERPGDPEVHPSPGPAQPISIIEIACKLGISV